MKKGTDMTNQIHGGTVKHMDHAGYQKRTRKMTDAALLFVISDCQATLRAWDNHPNSSYYMDEICYCSMELKQRADRNAS